MRWACDMAARRFLVPGFMTLAMLIVLIGLGTWQVQRLHWKEGIIARIAAAEAEAPVPLVDRPAPYTKVAVQGRFLFDRAALYGAEVRDTRAGPTMGSQQIVPLERAGAPPILVDRGWIPQKRGSPLDDPAGAVTAVGIARPEPFVLVALGASMPEVYPAPAQHLPRPPNNHLSYVITWYGLAVSLVVIFFVWVRKASRS